MAKGVVLIFGFIIGLALTIAVMIFGWGLEPKSWWWILGGGVGIRILVLIMEKIGARDEQ